MYKSIAVIVLAVSIHISCMSQEGSSVNISQSVDNDKKKMTISETNGIRSLKIETSGDIAFNDEETAIKSMSSDAYLKYKESGKKLTAEKGNDGNIYYTYDGGASTQTLNEEGKQFLAKVIKTLIGYGIGAEARVEQLYRKGGTPAVLEETGKLKSDYVKSIYLGYLLKTNTLKANDLTAIADKVSTLIGSDYEKSKLLRGFSAKYLSNATTAAAYLNAVKSIGSDYEKASALKNALQNPLSNEQFAAVIKVAATIGSDYEKAGVLEAVLDNNKLPDDQFLIILAATATIESDYEKAGVLKKIFHNDIPANRYNETLAVAGKIGSDYEKAGILSMLAENKNKTEAAWIQLINTVEGIGSDYEKSSVLVKISNNMPLDDNIKAAYMKAAKSISSEYELGKAVKAMRGQ